MSHIFNSTTKRFLIHVVLPLLLGFIYYYIFCPDIIIVKKIDTIIEYSYHLEAVHNGLSLILRYYLLDALWAYSLTHCAYIILGNNMVALKFSAVISVAVSVLMEVLQMFHMFPGTYDMNDIITEIIAVFVASFIIKSRI